MVRSVLNAWTRKEKNESLEQEKKAIEANFDEKVKPVQEKI